MSFPTLWHTLIILPSMPATEPKQLAETRSLDLDRHLPRWERHPKGRSGRDTGEMTPEWIRRHLP